ncbi:MAG: hypothetical protein ACREOW_01795 [Thermodesulfobacteriota bacterium]
MKILPLFQSIVCSVLLIGCVETLIAGSFYRSSKQKQAKQEFMENFNQTNVEREKAGLQQLDLCTEQYHFDEGWAKNDPECKKRVEAYEAGDKNALGIPQLETKSAEETPALAP